MADPYMSNADDAAERVVVVEQWLRKAERDLASARRLLDGEPPFLDTAVYHCQQAAEKALKGFLASRDRPVRKVHDLVLLLDECICLAPSLELLSDEAAILTPYGTAFRYPGDMNEPEMGDASEAVAAARRVIEHIRAVLNAA